MDRQFLETQRIILPVPTDGHPKKAQDEMIGLARNLAAAYCVSLRAELMQRCGVRFHAASSVLRVFPATHGFDFHEFVKTEQSTFPAVTRLLVATKRAARAKAYAVGFDHA